MEEKEIQKPEEQPLEENQIANPDADTLSATDSNSATMSQEEETECTSTEKPDVESPTEERHSIFSRKNKKEEQLKKQIDELEQQKKTLNEKFLHLYSEFDNYKKRTNREKLDLMATASEHVIVALLPILDDFERAITANEKVEDLQVMRDGFNLIYNKFLQLLKSFDVTEIEAQGADFDTDCHEAVAHLPAPTEEQKGKVIDVAVKGYKIKEKVIRYSKVVVGQ